jgi:hypothetical protein
MLFPPALLQLTLNATDNNDMASTPTLINSASSVVDSAISEAPPATVLNHVATELGYQATPIDVCCE